LIKDKYKKQSSTKGSLGSTKERFMEQNNKSSSPDFLIYQPDPCLVN